MNCSPRGIGYFPSPVLPMALLRASWSYPAQPCLPLPDSHTTAECQHGRKPQSAAAALSCSNQAICLVLLPLAPTLVPTSGPGPMLSRRVPVMVLPAGTLAAAKVAPLALRLWGCASCLCRGGVPAPASSSVPPFLAKRKHNRSQVSCRTGAQCMAATATGKGGSMGRQHRWGATALGTHQPVPGWVWAGVKPQRPPQAGVAAGQPGSSCQSCSSSMLLLAPPAHGCPCVCPILCHAGPWPRPACAEPAGRAVPLCPPCPAHQPPRLLQLPRAQPAAVAGSAPCLCGPGSCPATAQLGEGSAPAPALPPAAALRVWPGHANLHCSGSVCSGQAAGTPAAAHSPPC